jgi:anti-sigma B factor antagonist
LIIDKRRVEGMVLLSVEGIIKLGQSAEFLVQSLERTLDKDEGHVLLDLSKINYIDSTGIGELVGYLSRFGARDRKLILVSPSERIRKLLEVAQISNLFPTYDDLDAALAAEGGGSDSVVADGPEQVGDPMEQP